MYILCTDYIIFERTHCISGISMQCNGMWPCFLTHVACNAYDTVTNSVQVSVSIHHAVCSAHTVNMNSSSLGPSESDRQPSPLEGDYTNLCKACKWFILQSTTKGFFTTPRTRRGKRERDTHTLTPTVIHTFTTTYNTCNKKWWNLCLKKQKIKLRGCIQGIFSH